MILELEDHPTLQLFLAAKTGQTEKFEEIYQGDDYQNPKDDESKDYFCFVTNDTFLIRLNFSLKT